MQLNTAGWPSWAWTGGGVLLSVTFALLGHTLLYRVLWRMPSAERDLAGPSSSVG